MSGKFHFTKDTVSATCWCKKCGKPTLHQVLGGKRGGCTVCMEKPSASVSVEEPAAVQTNLFGG